MFCVDEKTAIQALDRLDPVLPLSPGRAERHGFEYYRHGTQSLYAALDVQTGRVEGKATKRHASADFIAFLTDLIGKAKWAREIHIVLDNLSAHKTQAVEDFSCSTPRCAFTSRQLTRPGSTKSKSGSPRSNVTSSLAASSLRLPIFAAS